MSESLQDAPTARARALVRAGEIAEAERVVGALIGEEFPLRVARVAINRDAYSLNSLNGTVETDRGPFFFKFHQEEGEDRMAGEYYRARILAEAGLPVDLPVEASTRPGRQILLYRLRHDRRLAEVARDLDMVSDQAQLHPVLKAQITLDHAVASVYQKTLHPITADQSATEPVHRLFHERLRDFDRPGEIGGRFASFYRDREFELPGLTLDWRTLGDLRIAVNGVTYRESLGALFDASFAELDPRHFGGLGVVGHGDAHNANVWYEESGSVPRLTLFDPAFAGEHVPALLAEVKPTFHNIFAHPFWLYEPQVAAERFMARVERRADVLAIETDWTLSPLRRAFLDIKAELLWRPLLRAVWVRDGLQEDWRRLLKLALFCCPTLVMNLRAHGTTGAGSHNPVSSAIGLAVAVMMGSEPEAGASDALSRFLDAIEPVGGNGSPISWPPER
ncbi:MAG TPA: hypothetical protein VMT54_09935 [Candidatus Cybelea sp.]|nr:hypothetical protein [Candidatus Cybelea sp.]